MSLPGKTAVVLLNLGGPDGPEGVQPFLFNLFNDPAIIGAPAPIRWLLAKLISKRRAPVAKEIYKNLGGGSPLLPNTLAQAAALESAIIGDNRCFVAMRYWHPLAEEAVAEVKAYAPDRIILLPLYPQYSTTTTGSSVLDWEREAHRAELDVPTHILCCYFDQDHFVSTIATRVRNVLEDGGRPTPLVIFTAHGLPKNIVAGGDPYQWQVERTADAIVEAIDRTDLDWVVCYQSRIGPLKWIQPYTSDVLYQAGCEGRPVIVVPIGFTSEHSETLVELDIEYRELAEDAGVPRYTRIETVGADPNFIEGLAELVTATVSRGAELTSDNGSCRCPDEYGRCPYHNQQQG